MRIGIVTDATCDLPVEFTEFHGIEILPVTVRIEDQEFVDVHDPAASLMFYDGGWGSKGHDAETRPFDADQIHDVFLDRLVKKFDYVFCITVQRDRSRIYENATRASYRILRDYRQVRAEANIKGPFAMRVIDSNTAGGGQGVVVAEASRMIREGLAHDDIRHRLDSVVGDTCTLLTANDLSIIRTRSLRRGEKSVGLAAFLMANALDIKPIIRRYRGVSEPLERVRGFGNAEARLFELACEQISHRITSNHVVVSYGGRPEEITALPGYLQLKQLCADKGVELLTTPSSMSFAVNIGQGALGISFGTDDWKNGSSTLNGWRPD